MGDEVSETAFRNAVSRGDWEQATSLLLAAGDRNAFVTLRGKSGRTALHKVACAKEPDIRFARLLVEIVVDKDKYITLQDNAGWTALHHAALSRHSDIAGLLIESVTDKNGYVTLKNHDEETTLHFAALSGCFDIAGILIENATDKNKFATAQTHNGWTALHYAARAGCSDVALLLIENVADKNKFVTTEAHQGWTALHEAASQEQSFLILKEIVRNAQDKNYINLAYKRDGRTALHQAVLNHPIDTTLFLLQNGAMPALLDTEGNTAWDLASIPGSERWEVITGLLLRDAQHGYMGWQSEGWGFITVNNMAGVNQRLWDAAKELFSDAQTSPDADW
ncbi:ankyrin repeat-containing domain protein [Xylaria flabelliformis]|nr:ankyrin repeat-containing domain protein [Xylaria flabelliformis]